MALFVGLYCRDERNFVFRTPAALAVGQFATKIGIVDFDTTRKKGGLLAHKHDLHEFVLDSPCCSITNTKEAFELQNGDIIFVLGLKKHRLEPYGQGYF